MDKLSKNWNKKKTRQIKVIHNEKKKKVEAYKLINHHVFNLIYTKIPDPIQIALSKLYMQKLNG